MENADAIDTLLATDALARVAAPLRALVRPAIKIVQGIEWTETATGDSRLGGTPDLPPDTSWQTDETGAPLAFIAQICLADVAGIIADSPLPRTGWLQFYFEQEAFFRHYFARHDASAESRSNAVIFVDANANLVSAAPPDALSESNRYPQSPLAFEPVAMLPSLETCYLGEQLYPRSECIVLNGDEWLFYADAISDSDSDFYLLPNVSHLLGYAQQGQPRCMEASYEHYRAKLFPDLPPWDMLTPGEKQREHEENTLLLQVEPFTQNAQFGRGGALYYFARRGDIGSGDFSKAWAWVQ